MKKLRPRIKHASDEAERDHLLNCICWLYAKDYPQFGTRGGTCCLDIHPDGDRIRLIPSALNEARGKA